MSFVTYENRRNPHVTIHLGNCNQIAKNGGQHKYKQGSYKDHATYQEASQYAEQTGLPLINCSFCKPSNPEKSDTMTHPLFSLLRELEAASIHYTLGRYRDETILVSLTLVGERVEVDVFEDGHMEVSRFPGSESIVGGSELVKIIIDANQD